MQRKVLTTFVQVASAVKAHRGRFWEEEWLKELEQSRRGLRAHIRCASTLHNCMLAASGEQV